MIIEYTGRTENGTVFDTTDGRGPAPFLVMQVFPASSRRCPRCRRAAVTRSSSRPAAYGKNPPPGSPIGPNEDLSFDVHVAAGRAERGADMAQPSSGQ